jgi:hydroxymethylpyrimidine/phosphomethylpyrimidine kinase
MLNQDKMNHVVIRCPEEWLEILLEKILSDINDDKFKIGIIKYPRTVYAAAEWVLPTVIAITFFKPYL